MAAQARQSKVLRIAIIQDRKIKQERLVKAGESVRIGDDPKVNTFVIPKNGVTGSSFVLFQPDGDGYALRFTEGFGPKSKVSVGGAPAKLGELARDPGTRSDGDARLLPLTFQDRGKLDLDGVFVLFQFVAPPPVKAVKPIQAMDFRPRLLEDDDPVFLFFLAIWTALAVVLVLWVWNTEPPEYTMDRIPDRFAKIIMKEPVEPPDPAEDIEELEIETETVSKVVEPAPSTQPKQTDSQAPADPGKAAKNIQDAKDELEQSSKLLAKILATTGDNSRGTVADMWSDEDKGLGNLDEALAKKTGGLTTDANDPGLRQGEGGGTGEAASIGDLKAMGGGSSGVGSGPDVKVVAEVSLEAGSVSEEVGDVGKVRNTVRRYMGQMKYCYEQQLKKNSSLEGRVELGWAVYDGNVESPYVISNGTGDDELGRCMVAKLKRWTFPKDIEGDVQWPFVFRAKN